MISSASTPLARPGRPATSCELLGERQHPTCHRDGNPVGGDFTCERVEPFGFVRFACDKYEAARRRTSFTCSSSYTRLRSSRFSTLSPEVTRSLRQPVSSAIVTRRYTKGSKPPKSCAICANDDSLFNAIATASSRKSWGNTFGMRVVTPSDV